MQRAVDSLAAAVGPIEPNVSSAEIRVDLEKAAGIYKNKGGEAGEYCFLHKHLDRVFENAEERDHALFVLREKGLFKRDGDGKPAKCKFGAVRARFYCINVKNLKIA